MKSIRRLLLPNLALALALGAATPLLAKDSLGVFGEWGAFYDEDVPRCYAIAAPSRAQGSRDAEPFASVGTWPDRQVRGQVHFRTSRRMGSNSAISLSVGGQEFALTGNGSNAWASNAAQDAEIVAAMRAANSMSLRARDMRGNVFTNRYSLDGAATAIDAASVGCSRRG